MHRTPVSVFWFRRDLRLHDNTALQQALNGKYPVLPIFIFDTGILTKLDRKNDARVSFIHSAVEAVKTELERHGSTLRVFHGTPDEVFRSILQTYTVAAVYINRDYEPEAIKRDEDIRGLMKKAGVAFYSFKDHVIFEASEVLKSDGQPYRVFTPFKNSWLEKFAELPVPSSKIALDFKQFLQTDPSPSPTLKALGFEQYLGPYPSGIPNLATIRDYDKTRDFPALAGTSRLGIHLRFGTVSIREMVSLGKDNNNVWLNELIWREFYSYILQHFPYVAAGSFNKKYDKIPWLNDEAGFLRWCRGLTGYPIVDAGMRELNATGYMHNRVRMITASFLTKHLLIDWRWGEAYFASLLLDYDLASNNGGWQWAAGTGTDAQPYFRVFNPESQAERFDSGKEYIRKWLPEYETAGYPAPMVDHKKARQRAIDTYKAALAL